jgi:hypothetical protein
MTWKFVIGMQLPLVTNPHPKRNVFLVPSWHETMAIVLFKLDQLFILLLPFTFKCIGIVVACYTSSPNEPNIVQKSLSFRCCPRRGERTDECRNNKLPDLGGFSSFSTFVSFLAASRASTEAYTVFIRPVLVSVPRKSTEQRNTLGKKVL